MGFEWGGAPGGDPIPGVFR